jgi:hypothetical protein
MPTRQTISHADELYAGNCYLDGDSPDGRRGILIPRIYVREYGAPAAGGDAVIMNSITLTGAAFVSTLNLLSSDYCTGTFVTGLNDPITATKLGNVEGCTVLILDVPRNITWLSSDAPAAPLHILGRDEYGNTMAEILTEGAADTVVSGTKMFKYIDKIFVTADCASMVAIGVGNNLGLPYHLSTERKFLGLTISGHVATGATDWQVVAGIDLSTISTTSGLCPDVRGYISCTSASVAPNGAKTFTAMYLIDPSTRDKAYGVPQCTTAT